MAWPTTSVSVAQPRASATSRKSSGKPTVRGKVLVSERAMRRSSLRAPPRGSKSGSIAISLLGNRMSNSEIARVVVVRAGQMGTGIAQVCAGAGLEVSLVDVSVERAAAGKTQIERRLKRLAEK